MIEFYLASLDLSPYIILRQKNFFLFKDTTLEIEQSLYYLTRLLRGSYHNMVLFYGGRQHEMYSSKYKETHILILYLRPSGLITDSNPNNIRLLHTQNEWWTPRRPLRKLWKNEQKRLL